MTKPYKTIAATFPNSTKEYTYRCPLDLDVDVGDFVIVPNRNGYAIVEVAELHDTPQDTGNYEYGMAIEQFIPPEWRAEGGEV